MTRSRETSDEREKALSGKNGMGGMRVLAGTSGMNEVEDEDEDVNVRIECDTRSECRPNLECRT